MLMRKSAPQPATMRTPTGGRRIVMRTMIRAGAASDIVVIDVCLGLRLQDLDCFDRINRL